MTSGIAAVKADKTQMIGGWQVSTPLGKGGNGEVFRAERDQQVGALKRLTTNAPNRVARFRDEVTAMHRCSDIAGVLPVWDEYLEPKRGASAWFVMALAQPIADKLGPRPTLRQVVLASTEIATTLSAMHARGFSHRDIKPDNLFFFEERFAVSDFGLVSFEGKTSETVQGERIGPMFFMAPEMLISAIEADGRCADVFSLAKTLWVLATGQRYPQPGHYDIAQDVFRIATYLAEERTGPLDKLIAIATVNTPGKRPSMAEFAEELRSWLAPKATPTGALKLDTKAYAAELDRRRLALEAARERQVSAALVATGINQRLREKLRPLANEVADSLKDANFDPVNLNVDRFHWGFEVGAVVPVHDGAGGLLRLIANINLVNESEVRLDVQIVLDKTVPTTFGGLLWDKSYCFLEGGSVEDARLRQFRQDVVDEMPRAVSLALAMILGGVGSVRPNSTYSVGVQSSDGSPLEGAEVLLLDSNGVYLRANSNNQGIAQTGLTHFSAATALVSHSEFHGEPLALTTSNIEATLTPGLDVSSMIATRGWTSVKGLLGQIRISNDYLGQMFVSADDVAVDGRQAQAIRMTVGKSIRLKGLDGSEVSIEMKGGIGPCLLLDVYGPKASASASAGPGRTSGERGGS